MKETLREFIELHMFENAEIFIRFGGCHYEKYICSSVPLNYLDLYVINFYYFPTGLYLTLNDRFYAVD